MKIVCSTCHKEIEVKDGYQFKTCENCLTKKKAKNIVTKELRKLDREAQQQIKGLDLEKTKLNPIFRSYSSWSKFQKQYSQEATFEKYLDELRNEKKRIAYAQAEQEQEKRHAISKELYKKLEPFINFNVVKNKDCRNFRIGKLSEKFDFKTNLETDYEHPLNCEDCEDWLFNFDSGSLFDNIDEIREQIDTIEIAEEKTLGKVLDVDLSDLRKNEGMNEFIKSGKVEPLKPQYPKYLPHMQGEGSNAWQEPEQQDKPKPLSNQQRLNELDPNHSE